MQISCFWKLGIANRKKLRKIYLTDRKFGIMLLLTAKRGELFFGFMAVVFPWKI